MRLKIFTIFDYFLIIQYTSCISIIATSEMLKNQENFLVVLFAALTIFAIFFWNLAVVGPIRLHVKQLKPRQKDFYAIYFLMVMAIFTMAVYLIKADFPIFSESPEVAKLQVSNHPILVRYYRIIGPIPIFFGLLVRDPKLSKLLTYYCLIMICLGMLTAFRGYPIPYFFGLLALMHQQLGIKRAIAISVPVVVAGFIYFRAASVSSAEPIAVSIFHRLTEVQLLGTRELLSGFFPENYIPVISEIFLIPQKLYDPDAMSLQQMLYQNYHKFDVNKLELANFYFAEFHAFSNIFGVSLLIIFLTIAYIAIGWLVRTHLMAAVALGSSIYFVDGLVNGKLIFRIAEYFIFSAFVLSLAKIYFSVMPRCPKITIRSTLSP